MIPSPMQEHSNSKGVFAMPKTIWISALLFSLTLTAAEVYRADVNGITSQGRVALEPVNGEGLLQTSHVTWGEEKDRAFKLSTARSKENKPADWQKYTFSFAARQSGNVLLYFGGHNTGKAPADHPWLLFSHPEVNGNPLPNSDFSRTVTDSSGKIIPAGGYMLQRQAELVKAENAVKVNHDSRLVYPLPVEAGKTYAVSALVKPLESGVIRYSPAANRSQLIFRYAKVISATDAAGLEIETEQQDDPYGLRTFATSKELEKYPGVTIPLTPAWDLSKYQMMSLKATNLDDYGNIIRLRLDDDRAMATRTMWLAPGETRVLTIPLPEIDSSGKMIDIPKVNGVPAWAKQASIDTSRISRLLISLDNPRFTHRVIIHELTVRGERTDDTPRQLLPFIDQFGQYVHQDWPEKIHTTADFKKHLAEERRDLDAHPRLAGFDQYGGWAAGPKLRATGFFRVEQYQGKWFLVTPEGHLFFSHGPQTVDIWQATIIEDARNPERSQWFAPVTEPFTFSIPAYPGTLWYDYGRANLYRKYGKDYKEAFFAITHERLASWGQNSIGNASNMALCGQNKTPFFVKVTPDSPRPVLAGDQFYDVFHPDFRIKLQSALRRQALPYANNSWCVGFFIDNELRWGMDKDKLVMEVLKSPQSASKREFVADLQKKYRDIEKLDKQWGTAFQSWDELQSSSLVPEPARARQDFDDFYIKFAEMYFRMAKQELKAVAPSHLYLGARFSNSGSNQTVVRVAARYCDVVSINHYTPTVRNYFHDKDLEDLQVPILLSEFHFGTLDRGLFNAGVGPAADNQKERAAMYKRYILEMLADPRFVGCHYFQYRDQPLTGDAHNESSQIGFVDVADTPYPEMVQASREIAEQMYQYRLNPRNNPPRGGGD